MRNAWKRWLCAAFALVLAAGLACPSAAPAYAAGEMEILDMTGSQWLYDGEDTDAAVSLSAPADEVILMIWRDEKWNAFQKCIQTDSDGKEWACGVYFDKAPSAKLELCFRIIYDDRKAAMHSDRFLIEWTSYRGTERIAGANRYETARLIADKKRFMDGNGPYDHAVIASGTDFADALGGSYLANEFGAPILLVNKDPKVIKDTAAEIKQNMKSDGAVYILGGEGAVSKAMETELQALGITRIMRFAGKNRYDTNLKILEYMGHNTTPDRIVICSGRDFADALSASATGLPIMLVGDELTLAQEAYFMENDPFVYIAGGPGAVSEKVENEIANDFGFDHLRLYGANRYQWSMEIAKHFFPHQPWTAVLAYGRNFPDGLAGGPLAYRTAGPLLLVENNNYKPAFWYVFEHDPRQFYILGGPALISDETVERIMNKETGE